MKILKDVYNCPCGNKFQWRCEFFEKNDVFTIGPLEKRFINVKRHYEANSYYIIEVQCPDCNKTNSITVKK